MDEILEKLNALIKSGETDIPKIMLKLNKEAMLKTPEDEASLRVMNSINELVGENPLDKIKEMQTTIKANAEKVREAEMSEAFGVQVLNAENEPQNKKRLMAETLLDGKAINADTIKEVKENALFLDIAGKDADFTKNPVVVNKDGETKKDFSSFEM